MPSLPTSSSPISSINRTVNTVRSSVFSSNAPAASSILRVGAGHMATSSVYRMGENRVIPTSSVYHPGVPENTPEEIENDAMRDRIRYQYAQKKMREKRAEEEAQSDLGISVGTGGAFSSKKFRKGLIHMKYSRPDKYKNLSADDLKYFEGLVSGHARSLKVGGGFSKNTKLRMKRQLWKDSRAGIVKSRSDRKDMENLINELPGGH